MWVRESKIAAIGVRISRGVTMHGLALNVHTERSYFDHIVPCGMPGGDAGITTMASELSPGDITVPEVAPVLARVEYAGCTSVASLNGTSGGGWSTALYLA